MYESFGLAGFLNEIGIFLAVGVLAIVAWNLWMHYINAIYLKSVDWVMLEIIPPKEVFKSPAAMELVLNSLYAGDVSNWFKKYWVGELGQYFSLEIASIEGKIHFYVRFHKKFRPGFEAQLYAQYPQAEIKEVEDYTKKVPDFTKDGEVSLFGYDIQLNKEDPYPIKSYVDYGLDRAIGSLEEVERIDPITPMLEVMGSIGANQQMWVQILIQKDIKRHTVKEDGKEKKGKSWKDKARSVIKEQKEKLKIKDKEGKISTVDRPTKGEQFVVESIERHMNKPGFDCGIRVVYLATKKGFFNGDIITSFTGMFRQFGSEDLNSFKLANLTKSPDEPWKDLGGRKLFKKKKSMLSDYKDRAFFYGNFNFKKIKSYFKNPWTLGDKPFILSTEELATIWHLPGRVAETPTFTRIEAKKSEPPSNLPI